MKTGIVLECLHTSQLFLSGISHISLYLILLHESLFL